MATLAEFRYPDFPDYETFSDMNEGFRAEDDAFDELNP